MTPNVRDDSMVRVSQENFEVRVDERAVGGRANRRLLEILAEHFKIPKIKNHHPKRNKNKKQNNPSDPRPYPQTCRRMANEFGQSRSHIKSKLPHVRGELHS